MCQLGVFTAEFPDVADCNAQALLYIFMYIAFNNFCIWIFFYNYLQEGSKLYPARVEGENETNTPPETGNVSDSVDKAEATCCGSRLLYRIGVPIKKVVVQVFTRPPVLGSVLGLIVGLIPEVQYIVSVC